MLIIVSPHVPREHVGHTFLYTPPVTRQPRSKRLWKKLCKRRRSSALRMWEDQVLVIGDQLVMSPASYAELRRQACVEADVAVEGARRSLARAVPSPLGVGPSLASMERAIRRSTQERLAEDMLEAWRRFQTR